MQLSVLRRIVPYLPEFGPPWFRRKLIQLIPNKNVQKLRHIVDTMHERAVEIYQEKKRMLEQGDEALKDKVGEGKDLMSILRTPPDCHLHVRWTLTRRQCEPIWLRRKTTSCLRRSSSDK